MNCTIKKLHNANYADVCAMSQAWAQENITFGLCATDPKTLEGADIWICHSENDEAIGYLYGFPKKSEGLCVIPKDSKYFEIEEFYIKPEYRSNRFGEELFEFAERELKENSFQYILLSTATKDFMRILKFYRKLGFEMWTMTLFKEIS